MDAGQSHEILTGDHKGELGVILQGLDNNMFEVLTLAGHTHLFKGYELKEESEGGPT